MKHSSWNDSRWPNQTCLNDWNYKTTFKTKWLNWNQSILKKNWYSTVIIDCVLLNWKIWKTMKRRSYSQTQQRKRNAIMNSSNVNLSWLQQKQHTKCWWTKQAVSQNMWTLWSLRWRKTLQYNQTKMTETKNKIIYQNKSIEKDELFAKCKWERKFARVEMMMLIHQKLKISILEAHQKVQQLRPEREAFYSII